MTGLKVGLQFAKLASLYADEGNTVAARRNLREAQTAYEDLLRFLPKAKLTAAQRDQIATDLPRLKDSLETLGSRLKIDLPAPDC
jgi:hypothetical protein